MLKIYTKTGDKGKTSLYDGRRVSKASLVIAVLGEIDQLNAYLGILALQFKQEKELILKRQDELMRLASMVATYTGKLNPKTNFKINEKDILELETQIDKWQAQLPELRHFILPGGTLGGASAHFARTLCRSVERGLVALDEQEPLPEVILQYINRLSDWLFVLARYLNQGKDIIWKTD
jgi:cob(I)alamin adenosyltransferase